MKFTSSAARRRGAAFLLVATSALVLAACGGNGSDTNKNDGTGTAPTASTSTTTATTETTPAAADGQKVFSNNCSVCHGAQGEGGNGGPPITTQKDVAHNIQQVTNGGGGMPAFGNQLSQEEIKAVATYVAGTLAK